MSVLRTIELYDGTNIPILGQGTWFMGDDRLLRRQEIAALRCGVDLGMTLIDTAEMYGNGRSESLVGDAVDGIREKVFLVSKVYPHHAGGTGLIRSCEASLRRLRTDRLDLYLLHWRGNIPLADTVEGMEQLVRQGKILRWGVSNLDTDDMEELIRISGGGKCAVDQVLYHLGSRGTELDLQPWLARHGMPVMAYSPLAQAGTLRNALLSHDALRQAAETHQADRFQILLAWCLRSGRVIAIPKASSVGHVKSNAQAARICLTEEDLALLDRAFPAPDHKVALDMV
jgi:diketogulonate reductase-like aldo/keto reductase